MRSYPIILKKINLPVIVTYWEDDETVIVLLPFTTMVVGTLGCDLLVTAARIILRILTGNK